MIKFFMRVCLLLLLSSFGNSLAAQQHVQELSALIMQKDSLFWQAYNTCDVVKMADFFTDNLEFYHDKSGPTLGLNAMTLALEKGLCGNPDYHLRREAVAGSVKVYPLRKDSIIYGAVLTGEHVFYITEKGKPERLDGQARFTHLWLLKDSTWKMGRILSYDHRPAGQAVEKTATTLPLDSLRSYTGKYKGPKSNIVFVMADNDHLVLDVGARRFMLYPQQEGLFFTKDQDLTFEFVKENNTPVRLIVRQKGVLSEELNYVP
jgi:hypothetical protein